MDHAVDRALRTIQVYSFLIGLCLLIPYGVRSHTVTLPLGLVPACFSGVIGLVGLANGLKRRAVAIPFDSILLAFHVGIFIPGVLYLADSKNASAGTVMLGSYATMPLMADM